MKAHMKITKARTGLIMRQPFFGTLALRLKVKEVPGLKTAAVDGRSLYYDPEFIDTLTLGQTTGLIAHEVMHCAMLHHTRRGAREHKKWNKACDFAINHILIDAGLDLPDDGCVNEKWKGFTAEHIYTLLPEEKNKGGCDTIMVVVEGEPEKKAGEDPGGNGRVDDSPGGSSEGGSLQQQEESEWKIATAQAAHVAKQRGKLPSNIERLIEEIFEPTLPWRDILRRFMTEKAADDFTWSRPNRRLISAGMYLPSRESQDAAGEMVVIVDTSGSVSPEELQEFANEISGIHQDVKPRKLHVVYCDAMVNKTVEFSSEDELKIESIGGGGTDFRPPFEWINEHVTDVKCAVYLTDGHGPFPDDQPYPVMWVINNDQITPPFGEHLVLETEGGI